MGGVSKAFEDTYVDNFYEKLCGFITRESKNKIKAIRRKNKHICYKKQADICSYGSFTNSFS